MSLHTGYYYLPRHSYGGVDLYWTFYTHDRMLTCQYFIDLNILDIIWIVSGNGIIAYIDVGYFSSIKRLRIKSRA